MQLHHQAAHFLSEPFGVLVCRGRAVSGGERLTIITRSRRNHPLNPSRTMPLDVGEGDEPGRTEGKELRRFLKLSREERRDAEAAQRAWEEEEYGAWYSVDLFVSPVATDG